MDIAKIRKRLREAKEAKEAGEKAPETLLAGGESLDAADLSARHPSEEPQTGESVPQKEPFLEQSESPSEAVENELEEEALEEGLVRTQVFDPWVTTHRADSLASASRLRRPRRKRGV